MPVCPKSLYISRSGLTRLSKSMMLLSFRNGWSRATSLLKISSSVASSILLVFGLCFCICFWLKLMIVSVFIISWLELFFMCKRSYSATVPYGVLPQFVVVSAHFPDGIERMDAYRAHL